MDFGWLKSINEGSVVTNVPSDGDADSGGGCARGGTGHMGISVPSS